MPFLKLLAHGDLELLHLLSPVPNMEILSYYTCSVWHSSFTVAQLDALEANQKRAMRIESLAMVYVMACTLASI
jgi:hypothetical protein